MILSNIDNESIARTVSGPLAGADFDAVYTAQNIGSYKPDMKNFDYLLKGAEKELGVRKEEVLHTAQSLTHDCVPAKVCVIGFLVDTVLLCSCSVWILPGCLGGSKSLTCLLGQAMGMTSVWIDRQGQDEKLKSLRENVNFTWRFETLGEMAEAVEKAFKSKMTSES